MARKSTGAGIFSALTVKEADVLKSVLGTGAAVAVHVSTGNHDLYMETHRVMADIGEARRQRWNRENPDYKIGS